MSKFWSSGNDDPSSSTNSSGSEEEGVENQDNGKTMQGASAAISADQQESLSLDPDLAWETVKSDQIFLDPINSTNQKPDDCIRIVCMSDTHGQHREIYLPPGDVLVHGGDFTKTGEPGTIQDLDDYFGECKSNFQQIVAISGNHDMTMHPSYYNQNWYRWHHKKFDSTKHIFENCTYLEDTSMTTTTTSGGGDGLNVYGSPWSPEFYNWAFNLDRGEPIREVWDKIPNNTDILITHGPPLGRGDLTTSNGRAGCYDLLVAVQERIRPRVHIFGHIHEDPGATFDGITLYINASNLDQKYEPVHYPIVVDVPNDITQPARIVPPECNVKSEDLLEWCHHHGFSRIAKKVEKVDTSQNFPSGNDLLGQTAFDKLANKLQLHRCKEARQELRRVQAMLYSESF